MRPNIKPIPAIVILLAISALSYSVLSGGAKELVHEQEVELVEPLLSLVHPEPNFVPMVFEYTDDGNTEVLSFDFIEGEVICSKSPKEAVEIIYKTLNGYYGSDEHDLPIRFPEPYDLEIWSCDIDSNGNVYVPSEWVSEPNEPEYTESELEEIYKDEPALGKLAKYLYGYGTPPTAHYDITHFIPTWPDYIELEKDLIIHRPGSKENDYYVWFFNKGTKIYFKDEE